MNTLTKKLMDIYILEKYSVLSDVLGFLKTNERSLKTLLARLYVQSNNHREFIEELLKKYQLYNVDTMHVGYSKDLFEKKDFMEILLILLEEEMHILRAYTEILIYYNENELEELYDPEKFLELIKSYIDQEITQVKNLSDIVYNLKKSYGN
ncbi:MAG: hypothetical protein ACP5RZ_05820 [Thermoplasmata archaeon]